MDPLIVTANPDREPLFLSTMEIIRLNIYLQAYGMQRSIITDKQLSLSDNPNQELYSALKILRLLDESNYAIDGIEEELKHMILKAELWKLNEDFHNNLEDILGEDE